MLSWLAPILPSKGTSERLVAGGVQQVAQDSKTESSPSTRELRTPLAKAWVEAGGESDESGGVSGSQRPTPFGDSH